MILTQSFSLSLSFVLCCMCELSIQACQAQIEEEDGVGALSEAWVVIAPVGRHPPIATQVEGLRVSNNPSCSHLIQLLLYCNQPT